MTAESLTVGGTARKRRSVREARKAVEGGIQVVFLLCGTLAVGFVLLISIYLILSGLPAIRQIGLMDFLFGRV